MKYKSILEQYAAKGGSMKLEEAMHHITEMYMEQCGISASLRTIIYEAGEMLFELLLKDVVWKEKIGNEYYLFRAMKYFHDEYTLEKYERYDITYLSDKDREECCEMVIEELCASIDSERQVAIPYETNECEQKLQAFCWGVLLLFKRRDNL